MDGTELQNERQNTPQEEHAINIAESENVQENQQQVETQNNPSGNRNTLLPRYEGWKRALRCEILWLALVNLALISALIWDSSSECSGSQLKTWVYVVVPLQFIMMIPNTIIQVYIQDYFGQGRLRRLNGAGIAYLVSRLLNMFWIIWAIIGIVWTFQSKYCAPQMPIIYTTVYIISVMNCVILGFPVIVCCCTVPTTLLVYFCCPAIVGLKRVQKASPRLIKKVTTAKKFEEGLVRKEDASCAICLCDYEPNEEIRFLQCEHHFHSECIMEWLVKNKTCPFCKQEIDKKPEKKKDTKKETTSESTPTPQPVDSDDEEVPLRNDRDAFV